MWHTTVAVHKYSVGLIQNASYAIVFNSMKNIAK